LQAIEPNETKLVQSIVKKDWVCLDIGANIGYYTVLMAKLGAFVYAFEPEILNYTKLLANTNDLTKNVSTRNVIVSDKEDENAKLYLCNLDVNGADGMHRTYPSKWCAKTPISVKSISIDDYLEFERVDFIKMDIEGAELGALKGMEKTLRKTNPAMLIEFHPPSIEEYGAKPEDEYNFLVNLGYKITLVPDIPINSYQQLDKLTRDESGGKNIFCQ
jgi:FkbM family methyltransferase